MRRRGKIINIVCTGKFYQYLFQVPWKRRKLGKNNEIKRKE